MLVLRNELVRSKLCYPIKSFWHVTNHLSEVTILLSYDLGTWNYNRKEFLFPYLRESSTEILVGDRYLRTFIRYYG